MYPGCSVRKHNVDFVETSNPLRQRHESPRGRNSSRARLKACAPIRFLLQTCRRSQSSLLLPVACQSTSVTRKPAYPVDTRALELRDNVRSEAAWPSPRWNIVPFDSYQDAPCVVFAQIAEISAGPKRRATIIVARPGLSCKSRTKLLNFALMVAPRLLGPAEGANICAL